MRDGRTFVSESPSGPQVFDHSDSDRIELHVTNAAGDALLLVGASGTIHAEAITEVDVVKRVSKADIREALGSVAGVPFVRPEIHAVGGAVRALGQAIRL